jgi:hypothetical protein
MGHHLHFRKMDLCSSFWAMLMITTHIVFASNGNCQPENGTLTVTHSAFKNLRDYYCSGNYSNLHTIRLLNNSLSSLDAGVFSGVNGLQHLSVVQNLLEYVDPKLLHTLKELISLDLSYNRLRSLNNKQLFISQNKLQVLRLSYNEITSLDLNVLFPLRSLMILDLNDNPISCNCETRRAVKWCMEQNMSISVVCDEELPETELRDENCTHSHIEESSSVPIILTGIAVVVLLLGGAIVEVFVYCSRKVSQGDTIDNEHETTSIETSADQEIIFYRIRPNNKHTDYSKIDLPCYNSYLRESPQYEELTDLQSPQDRARCSDPGAGNAVTTARESVTPYAEPFQQTMKVSEIYAVPYQEPVPNNEQNEILYENLLHSKSNNDFSPLEVSVRNSLYYSS